MHTRLFKSKAIVNLLLLFVFSIFFSSCAKWKDVTEGSITTDIYVHVTVRDAGTSDIIPNKIVLYNMLLYNGTTKAETHIKTGSVTSNSFGEADLPVYRVQISSGIIARIAAYTSTQLPESIVPIQITIDDALAASEDNNSAEVFIEYTILE